MPKFDPGYGMEPFRGLCEVYPDETVYPAKDFRVEWGPIFHRGRLDGTARLLVIGQDPATSENVVRRILVGTAGRRVQGFMAKLGITISYVMINTFLYSVYNNWGAADHVNDPAVVDYRNRWIDAVMKSSPIEAVLSLGRLADIAWQAWKLTPAGKTCDVAYAHLIHPTQPESSSGGDETKKKQAMEAMLANWNKGLQTIFPAVKHPDIKIPLVPYGTEFLDGELPPIPPDDFPPGLPVWMQGTAHWAERVGVTPETKRATLVITAPIEKE
jgi:hypothetical protein